MSASTPHGPRRLLTATTFTTILLWFVLAATKRDPLLGAPEFHFAIEVATVVATSFLFVTSGGWLILRLAAPRQDGVLPTGLERVLIYGALTLAATFVSLRHFNFDLGAMLTTSAIVTAAIGFAMQPTLGSMIAGIALQIDRMPRVGDAILLLQEALRSIFLSSFISLTLTAPARPYETRMQLLLAH